VSAAVPTAAVGAAATGLPVPPAPPRLRVVPAPLSAPPYDDEPAPAPRLRLVPAAPEVVAPACFDPRRFDEAWFEPERTPADQLPPVRRHAAVVVQALVEVFAGARPLQQLRRELSMELYAEVYARLEGNTRRTTTRPDPRSVRSTHVQTRPEGIAEACATVRKGGRIVAVALRFEGYGDGWVCTELEGL
jgi:hypothetical protein